MVGIVEAVDAGGDIGVLRGDVESMDSFDFKLFCETAAAWAAWAAWACATACGRKLKIEVLGTIEGAVVVGGGGLALGLGESNGLHNGGLPRWVLVVLLGGTGGTTTDGGCWWW